MMDFHVIFSLVHIFLPIYYASLLRSFCLGRSVSAVVTATTTDSLHSRYA